MKNNKKVAIIGGGIFGVQCALELSQSFEIQLFEKDSEILKGATYANHNRHHYGFHYPRSPETIRQIMLSRDSFESTYGDCLDWDFDNYYCVSKDESKTNAAQYLKAMDEFNLEYVEEFPDKEIVNPAKVDLCLKVREGVYDILKLRELVNKKIAGNSNIKVLTNHEIIMGKLGGHSQKVLTIKSPVKIYEEEFDFVINVTYAYTNTFRQWFGFAKKPCQFNLQELDVMELPLGRRIGVTVQDGPFPSILPIANSRQYLLAHVVHSQLIREISTCDQPILSRVSFVEGNYKTVLDACAEYIPILKRGTLVRSIFVDRVVDSEKLRDDARLTELTKHAEGCWSIFSAKVITCVKTAKDLHDSILRSTV